MHTFDDTTLATYIDQVTAFESDTIAIASMSSVFAVQVPESPFAA
jgi:hypothetical protein